ncbi:cytochrome P450 [Apiospora arundinis]
MFSYAFILVALITVYYYHYLITPRKQGSLPLPPGPRPLPLIGNLHQAPESHPWLQYFAWGQLYGSVVHLDMLGQSVIVISSVEAAHDLLSKRGARYSDRPRMLVAAELALKGLHMLLRPYDSRFKLHQKMEAPLLSQASSLSYRPVFDLETKQLLLDLMSGSAEAGEAVGIDCHHHFERTTASSIYALVYGVRVESHAYPPLLEARAIQDEFTEMAQVGRYLVDSFPVLNRLPTFLAPWKHEAETHFRRQRGLHVGNLTRGLLQHPSQATTTIPASSWNFSKEMARSPEAAHMSTDELAFDLGIVADAALDTTTMSMDWFVVAWLNSGSRIASSASSSFVEKAQGLLDRVVGRERLPTYEDRPRLLYMDAIVEELLRWRPIAAAGIPHLTKAEDSYAGYRIPAGSVMVANYWALARDPVYGEDPEAFTPERWLEESEAEGGGVDGTGVSRLKDLPSFAFGFGRRICPGRHIARHSLWLQIARLLWAFDIEKGVDTYDDEGGQGRAVPAIDPLAATNGILSRPLPFRAVFKPRGPWAHDLIRRQCDTSDAKVEPLLDAIGKDRMRLES